jgi:DNA-binding XRE family transcriptional regulator
MVELQKNWLINDEGFVVTEANSLSHLFVPLRLNKRISRAEMAKRLRVSEEYLCSIENGKRTPPIEVCLDYAREVDLNPQWLKRRLYVEMVSSFKDRLKKRLGLEF